MERRRGVVGLTRASLATRRLGRDAAVASARLALGLLALPVLLAAAACAQSAGSSPPISHGGPVRDHVSFVDHLRAAGYGVAPIGDVRQPFLRARGTVLRISGGALAQPAEVQSYNYDDRDLGTNGLQAVRADADGLGPNGDPKGMSVTWTGPPHFYQAERVLVLYLGSDPAVLRLLADLLGPQFAGR